MKVNGIDASYYWAQDLDRATAFYTELLGAAPTWAMDGVFSEWTFGNDTTFGIYKGEEFKISDGVMFSVDSVPDTVKALQSKGAEVSEHVEETPVCWMGFGKDSEGNGFILHTRKTT